MRVSKKTSEAQRMAWCVNVATAIVFLSKIYAYEITCDENNSCTTSIINCLDNTDCAISCTSDSSCSEAIINCPNNGRCSVSCNAVSACKNADIKWKDDQPNEIFCGAFDSSCYGVHFKPYNQNTAFIQDCSLAARMCHGATFDCPQNAECNINCQTTVTDRSVCEDAIINGPINYQLTVSCNGGRSNYIHLCT